MAQQLDELMIDINMETRRAGVLSQGQYIFLILALLGYFWDGWGMCTPSNAILSPQYNMLLGDLAMFKENIVARIEVPPIREGVSIRVHQNGNHNAF